MATDKRWYYMATTDREEERLWDAINTPALRDEDECGDRDPDARDRMWRGVNAVLAEEQVDVDEGSSQRWYDMKDL